MLIGSDFVRSIIKWIIKGREILAGVSKAAKTSESFRQFSF